MAKALLSDNGVPKWAQDSEGTFLSDLLIILGDARLLWLPSSTGTTATDKTRHEATIAYSQEIDDFDSKPSALGLGTEITFNGTDEAADTPDVDHHSFGDGASSEPFSIVALVKVAAAAATQQIVARYDLTTGATQREWEFRMDSAERPAMRVWDDSANAYIGRQDLTPLADATRYLLVGTYDGGSAASGIRLYVDGVQVDDADDSSGTFVATENKTTPTRIGASEATDGTAGQFWGGSMTLVAITAKQLTADEVWAIKGVINYYFDLSL